MKYGAELSRRSVPEWRSYNLDYEEIKNLIRQATTPCESPRKTQVRALVQALVDEFKQINLFVKSKSGEIDRRIDECEKIVDGIAALEEHVDGADGSKMDARQRQIKLFRLHQEVARLTKDIQKLSRFIGAQHTGFRKLVKKYNKWSQNSDDMAGFTSMLESPDSFAHTDLTSKFLELSLLYEVVRNSKFTAVRNVASALSSPVVDRQFDRSLHNFDAEMVSAVSDRLIFWVHNDNVTELKVALLQHLTLYSDTPAAMRRTMSKMDVAAMGSDVAGSGNTSRRGSGNKRPNGRRDSSRSSEEELADDFSSVVYFDTSRLEYAQTAKDPCQARWVVAGGSCVGYALAAPTGGMRHFATTSISHDELDALVSGHAADIDLSPYDAVKKLAIGWVQQRQAVAMSKAISNRTRFINLHGIDAAAAAGGESREQLPQPPPQPFATGVRPRVWAALDTNIRLTRDVSTKLSTSLSGRHNSIGNGSSNPEPELVKFPHAILEVRWSGTSKPAWVAEIEKSHLVHPVSSSFSLYTHSVALFYSIHLQKLPPWMELIDNNVDIRRSANERPLNPRRISSRPHLASPSNSGNISTQESKSADSAAAPSILLNATSAVTRQKSFDPSQPRHQSDMAVRYWNEFDDGDDEEDLGIYIEHSDHDSGVDRIFSDENVEKLVRISSRFFHGLSKIKDVFISPTTTLGARMPSMDETASLLSDDDLSSDYGAAYSPRLEPRSAPNYHSFADDEPPILASQRRNDVLTVLYTICLVMSVMTVGILFSVILSEDVTNLSIAAYAFILVALTFSLGIGTLGMCLFLLRDPPVWWHQTLVFATFLSVVCFGVGCVAWVLSS